MLYSTQDEKILFFSMHMGMTCYFFFVFFRIQEIIRHFSTLFAGIKGHTHGKRTS